MMQLLMMDAEELADVQNFTKSLMLISNERRNKVSKILRAEKKRLSLAAGLLLKHAFFALNCEHLYHEIAYTELGKPFLPGEEFYFSLSHSGRLAICCISDQPVGCDIEKKRDTLTKFSKIFSFEEEITFLSLNETERINFFFKVWTCKESITKWMGKGITFPFENLTVMDGCTPKKAVLLENKVVYSECYSFEDYFISVCAEGEDFPKGLLQIPFDQLRLD